MTGGYPLAWSVNPPQPGDADHARYVAAQRSEAERLRRLVASTPPAPALAVVEAAEDPRQDPLYEEGEIDIEPEARPASTGPEEGTGRRLSQSAVLLGLATVADVFHTAVGEPYATVPVGDHRETHPIRSEGFRSWLRRGYHEAHKGSVGGQAMQDAIETLVARALFDGPLRTVAVRVAAHAGALYLDLGSEEWEAVEITSAGWRVVTDPPVRFRRPRSMSPLPRPVPGGTLELLRPFLNVGTGDEGERRWRLIVGYLVAALRGEGPYLVMIFVAEQGSGKTTAARVVRALIDPNQSPVRAEPREVRDLLIAARNGWLVVLDNLSSVRDWLSDALCRLSTGGGLSSRQLYTDSEEIVLDAQRPQIITGIEDVATRSDLLDRAIIIDLPRLSDADREPESAFWERFEAARPAILGALLDAASMALAGEAGVRLDRLPRMADATRWVTAAEPALGWEPGSFVRAYTGNRGEAHELALDASALAGALRDLLPESGGAWEGTAGELLEALAIRVGRDDVERLVKRKQWPTSPRGLAGDLRRLAPNLRAVGIEASFERAAGGSRRRTVTLIRAGTGPTGPTVPTDPAERVSRDGAGTMGTQSGTTGTVAVEPAEQGSDGRDDGDGLMQLRSDDGWDPELANDDDGETL